MTTTSTPLPEGTSSYSISVKAVDECYDSSMETLAVNVNNGNYNNIVRFMYMHSMLQLLLTDDDV